MQQVLSSEWVHEPHPGVPRRLCTCWKLLDCASDCATPSDLRLLAPRLVSSGAPPHELDAAHG